MSRAPGRDSFCLALAALPAVKYPSDLLPSRRFYEQDLAEPEMRLSGHSQITLSERPGIGVDPNPESLEKVTVDRAVIKRT